MEGLIFLGKNNLLRSLLTFQIRLDLYFIISKNVFFKIIVKYTFIKYLHCFETQLHMGEEVAYQVMFLEEGKANLNALLMFSTKLVSKS